MKKLLVLLVCAVSLVWATTVTAQLPGPGVRPVVKGGMVVTILNSDEIQDGDAGFGFSLGAGAFMLLGNPRFAIQAEINYVDKRAWVRVQEGSSPGQTLTQFEMQYKYLDVPVLIDWIFFEGPEMRAFLQGGPVASFLLGAKIEDQRNGEIVKEKISGLNDATFSMALGAGLQAGIITVEMRYYFGVTKIGDTGSASDPKAGDPRLDTLNFIFGLMF